MTTITAEVHLKTDDGLHTCFLCGVELDPLWDDCLCPTCRLDEEEKLADYVDEQLQARFPL